MTAGIGIFITNITMVIFISTDMMVLITMVNFIFTAMMVMTTREQMATRRRSCILVEGSPGYGKTTLARKIAADWGEKVGCFRNLLPHIMMFL